MDNCAIIINNTTIMNKSGKKDTDQNQPINSQSNNDQNQSVKSQIIDDAQCSQNNDTNIECDFAKLLRPHTPKNGMYENICETSDCVFCGHNVISEDNLVPIKKYKVMVYACYCCYNIFNLGISPDLFVIAMSKLSQYEIVMKTHEVMKKSKATFPPHISIIDPNAVIIPLSTIEYAYVFKYVLKKKIKKTPFLKMKVFFNSAKFDYSEYSGKYTKKQLIMIRSVDSGMKIYSFTENEKKFLDECFYTCFSQSDVLNLDMNELINHMRNTGDELDEIIHSLKSIISAIR
jgi:hypothetical protein